MKVKVNIKGKNPEENVGISTEFLKLDSFLKFAAIVATGGEAKLIIQDGLVKVNDEVCMQRGKKLYPGDRVNVDNITYNIIKQ